MQIRRLRVRNIRSYLDAEVTFPEGTTFLSGDVGAGKTSLLQAIEMALFGFAEVDADFLVRHGAPHAEVALSFEGEGHSYEIVRRFKRVQRKGRTTFDLDRSTFSKDGATAQYSQTELRQRVIELLGFPDNPNPRVPSNLWRWAVYIPQERMREVLLQGPEERRETIRRALGIDRYRIAADNTQLLARELRQRAALLERSAESLRHFDTRLAELREEIPQLDRRVAETAEALAREEQRYAEGEAERQRHQEALSRFSADRRELEQREEAMRRCEGEIRHIEAQLQEVLRKREETREALGRLHSEESALAGADDQLRIAEEEFLAAVRGRGELQEDLQKLASVRSREEMITRTIHRFQEQTDSEAQTVRQYESRLAQLLSGAVPAEPHAPDPRSLPEIDALLVGARAAERETRDRLVASERLVSELDELLAQGTCPRCHQAVRAEEFAVHRSAAVRELAEARAAAGAASEMVSNLERIRQARADFEHAKARYESFLREKQAVTTALEEARLRYRVREKERQELEAQAEKAHQERATLAEREAEAKALQERERVAKARVDQCRQRWEERQRLGARRQELALLSQELEVRAKQGEEERARRRDEQVAARARYESLREALSTEPAERAALVEAEARLQQLRRGIEALHGEQASARTRRKQAVAEQARAREEVRRRSELTRLSARRIRTADWIAGPFREALLQMEATLLHQSEVEFQRHFTKYFSALVDDPSIVARVDNGFSPHVLLNGTWTPPEALSGGERTSLALAFRLALGAVVRSLRTLRLDTLILDEPTDGFSGAQIHRMTDLLDQLALPQIILVSHEEELARTARQVFYVHKRQGISIVAHSLEGAAETRPS